MLLAKFRCASWSGSGDHIVYFPVFIFLKHSCSVHFCLMNLVMISQTAQCLNTNIVFAKFCSEIEAGEQEFDRFVALENERLTVFVCYHHAVRKL